MLRISGWAAIPMTVFVIGIAAFNSFAQEQKPSFWAYSSLNIPNIDIPKGRVITVAVVDGAFNVEHNSIKKFISPNPAESLNGVDDDGNGFTDDLLGWDVADMDNDVSIPEGREEFFKHGTMVASIIAQVTEHAFGESASSRVRILPVKAGKDNLEKRYLMSGYDGIDYAIRSGADIIVCAWGGGEYDASAHDKMFREAKEKGILILAAAGNFFSEKSDPPASINSVYAIAGVDSNLVKPEASNYGRKICLSGPGESVYAAHPSANDTYSYLGGTSSATAIVGGCAAILKVLEPEATPQQIMDCLINTAYPLGKTNPRLAGKLGSGFPQLQKAVAYMTDPEERERLFNSKLPSGSIHIDKRSKERNWEIRPDGDFKTYEFSISGDWSKATSPTVRLYSNGSSETVALSKIIGELALDCDSVDVQFDGKNRKHSRGIHYQAIPVDSTNLYCKEMNIVKGLEGDVTDGSGPHDYANNVSCTWKITTVAGKRIKLMFSEFDTEIKKDQVLIFNGQKTLQENLIAKFSGPTLPPTIVTGSNEILVWFLTNDTNTGKGWKFNYTSSDEEPGVKNR